MFIYEAKHEDNKNIYFFLSTCLFLFSQMTKIPSRLHVGPFKSAILPYNQFKQKSVNNYSFLFFCFVFLFLFYFDYFFFFFFFVSFLNLK